MNEPQRLWWEQARSEHAILLLLRRERAAPCHQLHYLQMVTEKLSKAYFWRFGRPPEKSHAGFVQFLRVLRDRSKSDRARIARLFGIGRAANLKNWIAAVAPLAYEIERLAPAIAGDDGPNPEYPWPHAHPTTAPYSHEFAIWGQLIGTDRGRQLLGMIDTAVAEFPRFG